MTAVQAEAVSRHNSREASVAQNRNVAACQDRSHGACTTVPIDCAAGQDRLCGLGLSDRGGRVFAMHVGRQARVLEDVGDEKMADLFQPRFQLCKIAHVLLGGDKT